MQVKGLMPPKDGISHKTPTGRAVGRNLAWHNSPYCSEICYAFAYIYKLCYIAKMRDAPKPIVAKEHLSLCVLFRYYEGFSSPLYPLSRAIVT